MSDALHKSAALFGLLCIAAVGCGPQFGLPRLCDPQSESTKLAEAKRFDPYPDPTIGGDMRGARPIGFMNPRPEPDLLAKEQMVVPNHVAVAGPPGSMPGAPAVVLPATPSYPPGSVAPPPGAVMPPVGPAGPTPQVVYPQSSTNPPGGTWTATAAQPVAGTTGATMAPVSAGFMPNTSAAPAAYGKALSSP
jgi:hypothetical protein